MPTVSRRHHYVTRAYLEGFLEPTQTKLHCYGRGRSEPFCAAPVNLANIRDYHSFIGADGKPNDALERQIAETVEGPGIQIIRKLSAGRNRLVRDERALLAYLVALQRCRVPYEREFLDRQYQKSIIEMLEEMDGLAKQFGAPVNELESAVMATKEAPPPGAWKSIRRCDLESELRRTQADPRCFSRESFFVLARDLAMVFARMKWTVLYASGPSHFITSDCPVAMTFLNTAIPHVGALRPDSEISFPLSRLALLKMQHDGVAKGMPVSFNHSMNTQKPKSNVSEIRTNRIEDDEVQHLNHLHADQAQRWAFSGARLPCLEERMRQRQEKLKTVVVGEANTYSSRTYLSRRVQFLCNEVHRPVTE